MRNTSALMFILLFLAIQYPASAQFKCGHDHQRQELLKQHPEIAAEEAELEEWTKNFLKTYENDPSLRSGNYIIPVVFHLIHLGGAENISDAQVIDAVRILNEDFNKRNADTATVVSQFKNIVANVGVEFRLANLDPYGNCTNGINRIYSTQTYVGNDYSKLENWPRDRYLNIWVFGDMASGVAGYAYLPGSVDVLFNTPPRDGIVIRYDYTGSIGTSNYALGRALTHEVGHYLNLWHPWGPNNEPGQSCGDDQVDDTPITRGFTSCNLNQSFCTPGVIENAQNYMDYSYCMRMFTEGQKARMVAALNSDKSDRNNLYTPGNLSVTGTENIPATPCAPIADFGANRRTVCTGETVTFTDGSYNGEITSYLWEFPNGNPSVSTAKNPQVQFNTTGWQPVKLTVSNAQGISVKTDTSLVFVTAPQTMYVAPYYEGFESADVFNPFGWSSVNYDRNLTGFQQTFSASRTGNGSVMLNNYNSRTDRDFDEIISPAMDLTGLTTQEMRLSFNYSLASWNQDFGNLVDSIVVSATANCGLNWTHVYRKGGSSIVNAGYQMGYFVPTKAQAFWRNINVAIPSAVKQSNVRFRIRFFSSVRGNNLYIDDFNVGLAPIPTGVDDVTALGGVSVFPNPFSNTVTIENLPEGNLEVEVRDIAGRLLVNEPVNEHTGDYQLNLDVVNTAGVYFLTVRQDNQRATYKLLRQ